ncbi:hypothetical protein WJX73_000957 [Symbiochloris irregularis]|uniref:Uncharacterized protein n=1 Tax=Symbiochloris irregularis TaxID=706552 RepID=A0AAW1PF97_9CHLO
MKSSRKPATPSKDMDQLQVVATRVAPVSGQQAQRGASQSVDKLSRQDKENSGVRAEDKGNNASGKNVQRAARVLRERRALQSAQKSKTGVVFQEDNADTGSPASPAQQPECGSPAADANAATSTRVGSISNKDSARSLQGGQAGSEDADQQAGKTAGALEPISKPGTFSPASQIKDALAQPQIPSGSGKAAAAAFATPILLAQSAASADMWRMLDDAEASLAQQGIAQLSTRSSTAATAPAAVPEIASPKPPVKPLTKALSGQSSLTAALSGRSSVGWVEGVRGKIAGLQEALEASQAEQAALERRLTIAARQHKADLSDAQLQVQVALQEQRHESNAASARQLKLIDRLRADKEALASQAADTATQVKELEARHAQQVTVLKDGWAKELKRQREVWGAGEKQRRDALMAQKARAVKDQTLKGLEPEMQRLITQHQSELAAVKQQANDACQQRLHDLMVQRDARELALREAWTRERDAALDREQAAASERLRATANRYEEQLQEQRQKLMAEVSQYSAESSGGLSRADRERLEDQLHQARQEALQAKKAAEHLTHDYVAKQRQYDVVAKDMKEAHEKMAEGLRSQVALNQETAARSAGEKAMRGQQEELQAARAKVQAAGKDADNRCKQLQQQLSSKEAEKAEAAHQLSLLQQDVARLRAKAAQQEADLAGRQALWQEQAASKEAEYIRNSTQLRTTIDHLESQVACQQF